MKLEGEYKKRGEYHKYLDPNWSYYPIYIRKMAFIDRCLEKVDRQSKILDAGCGEGVLVEKYRKTGFNNFKGIDLNVGNEYVEKGNILQMDFEDNSFDMVLFLDVIEHLNIPEQLTSLKEIYRVLKKDAKFIISIPNLAHKASRWKFYNEGMLIRTANIYKHPGDRPIKEYIALLAEVGFVIEERIPIQLTLPPKTKKWMKFIMGNKRFEEYIYSEKRNPDDCFLNIFVVKKAL